MDMTFKISIPCDDDGFLTLRCPACREHFKLGSDDFQDDSVVDIFCPYCGLSESTNDFLTQDIMEAATREAENQAMAFLEKELGKMTKDLNRSKFIKADLKGNFKKNAPKVLFEENNMKIINFECCHKKVKILDTIPHSIFYCSFCGVNK